MTKENNMMKSIEIVHPKAETPLEENKRLRNEIKVLERRIDNLNNRIYDMWIKTKRGK